MRLTLFVFFVLSSICNTWSKDLSLLFRHVDDSVLYYPLAAEDNLSQIIFNYKHEFTDEDKAFVNYYKGVILFVNGDVDSSLVYIQEATDYFTTHGHIEGTAKCQFILGSISSALAQFEQAKINFFESIDLSETKNPRLTGLSYLGLARCYSRSKQEKKVYLQKGIKLLNTYGTKEQRIYSDYVRLYLSKDRDQNRIDGLLRVSKAYQDLGIMNRSLGALSIVADQYRLSKDYKMAHAYVDTILYYYRNNSERDAIVEPISNQNKALIYFNEKDYKNAEVWFKHALTVYEGYGLKERQYYAYKYLYRLDTLKGDYKGAFKHLSKAFERKKETYSLEKQRTAKLAEISSDINALRTSIAQLKWERLFVILISLSGLIIIILLVYIVLKKKNQRQKEIIQRNNELEKIALNTNEKLRLLQKQGIDMYTVNKDLKRSLIDDLEFVYDETFTLLKSDFIILSKTELRYALMFTLDYSNDVICSILSVQEAAVRKAKQRIRQKLDLQPDASLEVYFKAAVFK